MTKKTKKTPTAAPAPRETARTKPRAKENVVLFAGGNPQIAKGDGDAPVQAYVAAMPGWKHDVGQPLDALIVRAVRRWRRP